MRKHVLEKIVKSEEGKRKYLARRCHVCATHKKRSETRYILSIFERHAPQRGTVPEISHPQALLGSLVSVS
jgi:hypothetical protein